ncbi:RHS repeat protein, partial [Escherichia coli]|nr:RHS repeat protein [Escherichia coli]
MIDSNAKLRSIQMPFCSIYSLYDSRGRLTGQKDAQGRETRYEYSAAGDLTATISPDGK